jgi:hypothetical protein
MIFPRQARDKQLRTEGVFRSDFRQTWEPNESRECRFVFIGRDLDKPALQEGFMKCKCSHTLRFKEGDQLEALVGDDATKNAVPGEGGEWVPAIVVRTWDEGRPCALIVAQPLTASLLLLLPLLQVPVLTIVYTTLALSTCLPDHPRAVFVRRPCGAADARHEEHLDPCR